MDLIANFWCHNPYSWPIISFGIIIIERLIKLIHIVPEDRHHNSNSQVTTKPNYHESVRVYERWETLVYRYLVIICYFENRRSIFLPAEDRLQVTRLLTIEKYLFHTYSTHTHHFCIKIMTQKPACV